MLSSLRPRPGQQQSDTTKKTPPLPNPPISPIRTPEKLRGQSAQPIRQGEEVVRGVSGAVAIVKRGRGRPPRKRNVNGVCAQRLHLLQFHQNRPASLQNRPAEGQKQRRVAEEEEEGRSLSWSGRKDQTQQGQERRVGE